jgi:hypothetical protein
MQHESLLPPATGPQVPGYAARNRAPEGPSEREKFSVSLEPSALGEKREERKTLLARVQELEGELRVLKGMWAETIVNLSARLDELTVIATPVFVVDQELVQPFDGKPDR